MDPIDRFQIRGKQIERLVPGESPVLSPRRRIIGLGILKGRGQQHMREFGRVRGNVGQPDPVVMDYTIFGIEVGHPTDAVGQITKRGSIPLLDDVVQLQIGDDQDVV